MKSRHNPPAARSVGPRPASSIDPVRAHDGADERSATLAPALVRAERRPWLEITAVFLMDPRSLGGDLFRPLDLVDPDSLAAEFMNPSGYVFPWGYLVEDHTKWLDPRTPTPGSMLWRVTPTELWLETVERYGSLPMRIAEIIRALFPGIGGLVSPVFPRWLASAFLPRRLPRILAGFRAALVRYGTEHAYLRAFPRWQPGERVPE